jgi:hypothetical protein
VTRLPAPIFEKLTARGPVFMHLTDNHPASGTAGKTAPILRNEGFRVCISTYVEQRYEGDYTSPMRKIKAPNRRGER